MSLLEEIKDEIYLPEFDYKDIVNSLSKRDFSRVLIVLGQFQTCCSTLSEVIEKMAKRIDELESKSNKI